jgi:hypothetical protein
MAKCTEHAPGIVVEWKPDGVPCPLCASYESEKMIHGQLQTLRNFLRKAKQACLENGVEWCCMDEAFMHDPELRSIVQAKYDGEDPDADT